MRRFWTALQNAREYLTSDDELIVIDGASTDKTASVVEKHRDIVTLFQSEPDSGGAHGMNKGILASRGQFIKLVTDDDYFFPEAMRQAVAVMESHPELDAIMCGGENFEADKLGGELRLVTYQYLPESFQLCGHIQTIVYLVPCGLGLLLNRKCLSRVGLLDTTYRAVDIEYQGRLFASGADFRYLNIKLFRHVTYPHSGQILANEMARDRLRILLRSCAWPLMHRYSRGLLAETLGLDRVAGGDSMVQWIWYAERLRRGRLRPLLSLLCLPWSCLDLVVGVVRRWQRWTGRYRPSNTYRGASVGREVAISSGNEAMSAKQRLKILVIASWYPMPGAPVAGIFVRDQVQQLAAVHDVAVIAPRIVAWRDVMRGKLGVKRAVERDESVLTVRERGGLPCRLPPLDGPGSMQPAGRAKLPLAADQLGHAGSRSRARSAPRRLCGGPPSAKAPPSLRDHRARRRSPHRATFARGLRSGCAATPSNTAIT